MWSLSVSSSSLVPSSVSGALYAAVDQRGESLGGGGGGVDTILCASCDKIRFVYIFTLVSVCDCVYTFTLVSVYVIMCTFSF